MPKKKNKKQAAKKWIAPAMLGAGLSCGLFGTGGGLLVLPLLRAQGLDANRAQATAPAVMWPLCALSAGVYLWQGHVEWPLTGSVAVGLTAGAVLGALLLRRAAPKVLDALLAALMLYTGIHMIVTG